MKLMGLKSGVVGVVCAVTVLAVSTAQADIIYVDASCPGGDGSELDPYCSIQTAIDNAEDGDEIVVAAGTYFETIDFIGRAVWLHSSDGAELTIIDGTGFFHVVQCVSGEGSDTVLDGFTITGGNANGSDPDDRGGGMYNDGSSPTVSDCVFDGNTAEQNGGGMFNADSDVIVIDCTFRNNAAEGTNNNTGGGGMFNDGGTPTVTGCTFDGNTANQSGGAMSNMFASPTVTDCVFTGNIALGDSSDGGGAIFMFVDANSEVSFVDCVFRENHGFLGGAVDIAGFEPGIDPITLTDCSFTNNTATLGVNETLGGRGGALFIQGVIATLSGCTIQENQANATRAGPSMGGGILISIFDTSTLAMLINSTMIGNVASLGGAIYGETDLSLFSLVNATLTANTAADSGGGIWTEGTGTIANSILWANSDADGSDESAQIHLDDDGDVAVDFSCVQGLTGDLAGTGNIDADPLFVVAAPSSNCCTLHSGVGCDDIDCTVAVCTAEPLCCQSDWEAFCVDLAADLCAICTTTDLRLSPGSPCIDAGNNNAIINLTDTDLDGNPRFADDPDTADTGCGIPVIVDMGAYEYQGVPAEVVFADLNGDGMVTFMGDLMILNGCVGSDDPDCCIADLDLDGVVGMSDRILMWYEMIEFLPVR